MIDGNMMAMRRLDHFEADALSKEIPEELYGDVEQTEQIENVKLVLENQLYQSLRYEEGSHALNHVRNMALRVKNHKCDECCRYYLTTHLLRMHRKRGQCGRDDQHYGYLKTKKRFYFLCVVCGEGIYSRSLRKDGRFSKHLRQHSDGELRPFGLANRR